MSCLFNTRQGTLPRSSFRRTLLVVDKRWIPLNCVGVHLSAVGDCKGKPASALRRACQGWASTHMQARCRHQSGVQMSRCPTGALKRPDQPPQRARRPYRPRDPGGPVLLKKNSRRRQAPASTTARVGSSRVTVLQWDGSLQAFTSQCEAALSWTTATSESTRNRLPIKSEAPHFAPRPN